MCELSTRTVPTPDTEAVETVRPPEAGMTLVPPLPAPVVDALLFAHAERSNTAARNINIVGR